MTTLATGTDVPTAVAAPDDSVVITDAFGTLESTIVVYHTRAGGHAHGMLSPSGWVMRGAIATPPLGLPALSTGTAFPSVARIGGTNNKLLLTYRDAAGVIFEQVGTISRFSTAWTAPLAIVSAAGLIGSPATTTLESTTLGADGVLMVTARNNLGVLTWDLKRRDTLTGAWSLVTSVTGSGNTWGRPSIEVRPFRVGASTVDRLILSWRRTDDALNTWTRMSPPSNLVGGWTGEEKFVNVLASSAHAVEMHFDTRTGVVKGLRGVWSGVAGCPAVCPTGSACNPIAGGSATTLVSSCMSDDGLIQAAEYRVPGADAVVPLTMPDFNEWPMLRSHYCTVLRDEGAGTGRQWAPPIYQAETSASCALIPMYVR